jgi:TRAP-type C4-dicarboxylate transport system permease small subunit
VIAAVHRFRARFAVACQLLAAVLLVASVLVLAVQITLRVVFNAPLIWSEEVSRYLFVWVVYLGTVVGVIHGTHIRVTFAMERLGPRGMRISNVLTRIVDAFCFGFLFYWGIDLAIKYREAEFYSLPFWPQLWFYYAALPVGAGLSFLFTLLPRANTSSQPPHETML